MRRSSLHAPSLLLWRLACGAPTPSAASGQRTAALLAARPPFTANATAAHHQPTQSSLLRLTPRSSGAPTACHQAQATVQHAVFCGLGLAPHRRRPLTSNVRRCVFVRQEGIALETLWRFMSPAPRPVVEAKQSARYKSVVVALGLWRGYAFSSIVATHRRSSRCPPAVHGKHHRSTPPAHPKVAAAPNPSVKRSVNGVSPGPFCGALHSPQPGPGATPSAPAYLER